MNRFDCAFAHLIYCKVVDFAKCTFHYENRYRVSFSAPFKDGDGILEMHNVGILKAARAIYRLIEQYKEV